MAPAKLIVAVAAVMLIVQVQCTAACAAELCGAKRSQTESVPPCHKHHDHSHDQAPASCSFRLVVSSATAPPAPQWEIPVPAVLGLVATVLTVPPGAAPSWSLDVSVTSPPGIPRNSSAILRI